MRNPSSEQLAPAGAGAQAPAGPAAVNPHWAPELPGGRSSTHSGTAQVIVHLSGTRVIMLLALP
jgi:hypothetical protein